MQVHLVDGTYELFRYFYSPGGGHSNDAGEQVGAVRGVLRSLVTMLGDGATHLGVATDHVIESFRNDLWPTYKDGSGVDPQLKAQFPLVEDALRAAGFTVWAMVEQEADDALAAAAHVAADDPEVERAIICTPDKDLGQCVGGKVWQWDRRQDKWFDAAGVDCAAPAARAAVEQWLIDRFGVSVPSEDDDEEQFLPEERTLYADRYGAPSGSVHGGSGRVGASGAFHAKGANYRSRRAYAALKLNANFPGNPARNGLPTIQGAILLCDAENGALLGAMDSIEITLRRTAAASALAARHMARSESTTALICGCGAQARAHVPAPAADPAGEHRLRVRRPARARLAGRGLPGRAHRRADAHHPHRAGHDRVGVREPGEDARGTLETEVKTSPPPHPDRPTSGREGSGERERPGFVARAVFVS